MPKLKVELSIGFPTAYHKDEIDIDQEDLDACEGDESLIAKMCDEIAMDWANNYIEVGYKLV